MNVNCIWQLENTVMFKGKLKTLSVQKTLSQKTEFLIQHRQNAGQFYIEHIHCRITFLC